MKRVLGYVNKPTGESIKQMLEWYNFEDLPKSASSICRDIENIKENHPKQKITKYRIVLEKIGEVK